MKDGGPAFPVTSYVNADGETFDSPKMGMSLRDWLAGQALVGILASDGLTRWDESDSEEPPPEFAEYVGRRAVVYADATLAALAARAEGSVKDE